MEIRRYLDILHRRKWVVILATLVAVLVAGLGSYLQQPLYAAQAKVRVAQATGQGLEYVDFVYAERLMNTYAEILKSRPFLAELIQRLDLEISPEELVDQIEIEVLLNTELLLITVEDPDPGRAQGIANVLASLLVEQSQSLYFGGSKSMRELLEDEMLAVTQSLVQDREDLQALQEDPAASRQEIETLSGKITLQQELYLGLLRQHEQARVSEATRANSVSIVELAVRPDYPSKPRVTLNMTLAALAGLLVGIALVFLGESTDTTFHTTADLEAVVEAPPLASIPWDKALTGRGQIPRMLDQVRTSPASEAYRMLRSNLLSLAAERSIRTVMVTSAEPGTGKSTVVANLAASLAAGGHWVIAVDGDFRRPSLHKIFDLSDGIGFSNLLADRCTLDEALQDTGIPGLQVLTCGSRPIDPAQLLRANRLSGLLDRLQTQADFVLLDSPPLFAVAEPLVLAPQVDALLLVLASGQTTKRNITRALAQAAKVGADTPGLVFNREQGDEVSYYYHYGSHRATHRPARVGASLAAWSLALLVTVALAIGIGSGLVAGADVSPSEEPGMGFPGFAPATTGLPEDATGALGVATVTPMASGVIATSTRRPTVRPTVVTDTETAPSRAIAFTPAPTLEAIAQPTSTSSPEVVVTPASAPSPEVMALPTSTPVPPRTGFIRFLSANLYADPNDPASSFVLLPANWPVLVVQEDLSGFSAYGGTSWHLVKAMLKGEILEGYVPARLVEID